MPGPQPAPIMRQRVQPRGWPALSLPCWVAPAPSAPRAHTRASHRSAPEPGRPTAGPARGVLDGGLGTAGAPRLGRRGQIWSRDRTQCGWPARVPVCLLSLSLASPTLSSAPQLSLLRWLSPGHPVSFPLWPGTSPPLRVSGSLLLPDPHLPPGPGHLLLVTDSGRRVGSLGGQGPLTLVCSRAGACSCFPLQGWPLHSKSKVMGTVPRREACPERPCP